MLRGVMGNTPGSDPGVWGSNPYGATTTKEIENV